MAGDQADHRGSPGATVARLCFRHLQNDQRETSGGSLAPCLVGHYPSPLRLALAQRLPTWPLPHSNHPYPGHLWKLGHPELVAPGLPPDDRPRP